MLCLIILFGLISTEERMSGPEEAKSTAEILKCAEKDDLRGLHREPLVSTMECSSSNRGKAYIAWYNPYSGEAACHVYIYTFNDTKKLWIRKLAKVFRDTSTVSVEFGQVITIRDVKGKEIYQFKFE
jgi:hypothetical protein